MVIKMVIFNNTQIKKLHDKVIKYCKSEKGWVLQKYFL